MNMSQERAKHLLEEGAVLIIAGVPIGTEFGLDKSSYNVDEMFRGVKMIPVGPHYVFTAAKGSYGDSGFRVGFLHYFHRQEIVIREWDNEKEELRQRSGANVELEKQRITAHLKELDKFLAPYDFEQLNEWTRLTNHIDNEVVQRCSPECGMVRTSGEFESCPDSDRPKGASPLTQKPITQRGTVREEDLLPNLKTVQGTAPRYTDLPSRCPRLAEPSVITSCYMDSIDAVKQLFTQFDGSSVKLLAEIQFSFVLFVSGHSVESLAHWRKILALLSNSSSAIDQYRSFYSLYLKMLQFQLTELPIELLPPNNTNTVYKDVRNLLVNCMEDLRTESETLIDHLKKIDWTFDELLSEDPDDLPVIVDL